MNKVLIIILVLLLVVTGALGYYSFDLNKQVGTLSDELMTFRGETATQIGTISDEFTAFRGETATQISTLSDELMAFRGETATQIGTISDELTGFKGETATQISTLSDELERVSSAVSQSVINVSEVYEKVKRGVVEVIDGKGKVLGSGFVFGAEGHIVTNYHVVEGATMVNVVLYDGTTSGVSIIGSCKYSDIAVLKLREEASVEPLELADSNAVAVGEPVIVIGSPFGLTRTVALGVISQEARFLGASFIEKEGYRLVSNLIQHSAATNPGNSGGPLLNSEGEVIGLVHGRLLSIFTEEYNYAISSNKVERVARALIDHGYFDNPTLTGEWTLEDLTPEKARVKNLKTTDGILVTGASTSSGFDANDVIVSIDGATVRGVADLFNYLGEHKSPGDTVTLIVMSNKIRKEIPVRLAEGGVVLSDGAFQRSYP